MSESDDELRARLLGNRPTMADIYRSAICSYAKVEPERVRVIPGQTARGSKCLDVLLTGDSDFLTRVTLAQIRACETSWKPATLIVRYFLQYEG